MAPGRWLVCIPSSRRSSSAVGGKSGGRDHGYAAGPGEGPGCGLGGFVADPNTDGQWILTSPSVTCWTQFCSSV